VFEPFEQGEPVRCGQVLGGFVYGADDGFDLLEPARDDLELSQLERGDGERVTHACGLLRAQRRRCLEQPAATSSGRRSPVQPRDALRELSRNA
jgi:hypothetical protein